MHTGKMQTDYGRAVCEVLSAQITWLLGRRKKTQEALDLVEIKRVLTGMRIGTPKKAAP